MNNKPHLPSLLLLLYLLLCFTSPVSTSDSNTLLTFKSSLPNPKTLSNWVPHSPVCSFTGVICSNISVVTSLDLSFTPLSLNFSSVLPLFTIPQLTSLTLKSTNISGSLTPINGCSSYLAHLDLSLNSISSSFVDLAHFASCSSLRSLNLSSNLLGSSNDVNGVVFGLKVESLDLSFNHLLLGDQKILPWVLSNGCSSFSHLSFKGNKLMGSFSLVGCSNLEFLDLSLNNFSTHLPSFSNDCPKLNHLDLSSNKFGGQVGDSFTNLNNLVFLNVSKNELLGGFPSILSSTLEYLYLSDNHFHGVIPTSFPNEACSTLVEFDLSGNNFTGMIPTGFGSCSLLETFDISYNHFYGSLPFDMFLRMGNLKNLLLASNSFVGTLPDSISGFASLETLDLSSNNISGKIPSGMCENPLSDTLKELYLQDNKLAGSIPTNLGNCSHLVSLDLSFNFLNGRIPTSLGSLSKLKDLIIWMNHLEGEIPSELGYNRALENLILDYNQLTGTIPSGLKNCTNLNWISLSSNNLSGEIPSWIGSLANLAILKLSNNSFYGRVPAELGDCRSLLWLDLNSNFLNGSIPPSLSKQSGNMAVGLVVGKKFVYLRNDGNKECHGTGNLLEFAGIRQESLERIPSSSSCNFTRIYMGNTQPTFNHNGSMIFLDLSYNKLEGSIPKELGSMYYLNIMNLGNNNLSGPIPLELGGLKNVGVLDLSNNQLSGQIPNSLSGLTLLTEIDLSNNQLSGAIPETAQFETFPAYRFANNSGLCGYPLQSCDHNSGSNTSHKKSGKKASLVSRVAIGLLFSLFCIFGLIIVGIEVKRRRKKNDSTLDIYADNNNSNSNSGTINSAWKFTSKNEAMSISLATFAKPLRKLTFADLLEATNGFHDDTLIGRGGFGDVYKAKLKDGSIVAIKKLIHVSGQGDKEFTAEMETIGKIQYHYLVPLLGYCKVGDERLLVYEYMKYGSLEDVLHDHKKAGKIKLDWVARRKIAFGAARGLAFLHHSCNPHIIHRDMKSSNVLLDEDLQARVSDFGMARYMSAMDTHLSVSTLAGTPGYVPPEYYQSFKCSTKGDVYSYGVVLLELLTGKPPTDSADFGDTNLVGWVKQHAKLRVSDVFDPELMKEDPNLEMELLQHLKVACACLDDRPRKRPTMIQVLAMFKEIQAGSGLDSRSTNTNTDGDDDDGSLSTLGASFCTVDVLHLGLKEIPENVPRE